MKSSKSIVSWSVREWRRKQGREMRERQEKEVERSRIMKEIVDERNRIARIDPNTLPQVTEEGMYWFTDINEIKYLVMIRDNPHKSTMIEVGGTLMEYVDSIGVGEFTQIRSMTGHGPGD